MPNWNNMTNSAAFDALQRQRDNIKNAIPVMQERHEDEMTPPPPGFVQAPDVTSDMNFISEEDMAAMEETPVNVPIEQPVTREDIEEVMNETEAPMPTEERPETNEVAEPESPVTVSADENEVPQEIIVEESVEEIEEPEMVESTPEPAEEKPVEIPVKADGNTVPQIAFPSKSITQGQLRRIRINETDGPKCSHIQCRALNKMLKTFYQTAEIFDDISIVGTPLKNGIEDGIWLEGGANKYSSHVLLAADPQGKPLTPIFVTLGRKMVNGRNALVGMAPGNIILFGGIFKNSEIIVLYKVREIGTTKISHGKEEVDAPEFRCDTLVAFSRSTKNDTPAERTVIYEGELPFDITEDHPMVQAARKQMNTMFSRVPVYVNEFKDMRVNVAEFNRVLGSPETKDKFEVKSSLAEIREEAIALAKKAVWDIEQHQNSAVYTYFNLQSGKIVVYFLIGRYDVSTQTIYHLEKVLASSMKPTESFTYLGDLEENAIEFAKLKNELGRSGGCMLLAQRCFVPSEEEVEE